MPPGRRITGLDPSRLTTVDSTPTRQGPPLRIIATLSPSVAATCSARVGLMAPDGLALGAASGRPHIDRRPCAAGCAGTRIAALSSPALISKESLVRGLRG